MGRGYLELLRNRDFRNLWLGGLVSMVGNWFNLIALYSAIRALTSSEQAIAMVYVAKTVPIFVVSPIVGPIVDRFDRRTILLWTVLVRAGLAVGLIFSYRAESLLGLFACTVFMVVGLGIAFPTKTAVLPTVVEPEQVPAANALDGGAWSVMLAVGAALGGFVTHFAGIEAAFAIDALSFLVAATFFWRLPRLIPPARLAGETATLRNGVAYLLGHPYILATALLKPLSQLGGGVLSLLALFGSGVFVGVNGPAYVGILFAVRGMGSMVGALLLRRIFGDRRQTMRRLLLAAFVLSSASYLALSQVEQFWTAGVAIFFAGIGTAVLWVYSGTLLQLEADRRYHGRVFALEFGANNLVLGASSVVAGVMVESGMGVQRAAAAFGVVALIPAIWWGLALLRWGSPENRSAV